MCIKGHNILEGIALRFSTVCAKTFCVVWTKWKPVEQVAKYESSPEKMQKIDFVSVMHAMQHACMQCNAVQPSFGKSHNLHFTLFEKIKF